MFNNSKYTKIYNQLIERCVARNWKKGKGRERHHIIPQSLGGTNDNNNLVYITPREHFICHWLLIKMTIDADRVKMVYALNGMKRENNGQERYNTKITARVYEKMRIEFSKVHSETMKGRVPWNKGGVELTEEQYANIKRAANNRKIDPVKQAEGQRKRIEKMTGRKDSEETRKKKSEALTGIVRGPMSEEEKLKRSLANKGKPKKEGHADNVRKANLGVVSINKDGKEKKVKQDTLDQWLADGWQLGGRKRKSHQQ